MIQGAVGRQDLHATVARRILNAMGIRPRVVMSYAQSLDGRIATRTGASRWISGDETLKLAHHLRADHDAILVGIGTVLRDDPELTCRVGDCVSPIRVILDAELRTPPDARVFNRIQEVPTIIVCSTTASHDAPERAHALVGAGAEIVTAAVDAAGYLALRSVLAAIAARRLRSVFVEGGSRVITAFYRERLVDRAYIVVAPILIGSGVDSVGELGVAELTEAYRPRVVSVTPYGNDMVWELEFPDAENDDAV